MNPDQTAAFRVWVESCMFHNRRLTRQQAEGFVQAKIDNGQYTWQEQGLHYCPGPGAECLRCLPS